MADFVTNDLKDALSRHSTAALKDLAGTLGSYIPDGGTSHEDWVCRISQVWADPYSALHLAKGFPPAARDALGMLAWGRWNRSIPLSDLSRLLQLWGHSPSEALSPLIAFGAIVPAHPDSSTNLSLGQRRHLVENGEGGHIKVAIWPELVERIDPPSAPPAALLELLTTKDVKNVLSADPAELIARLVALWQQTTLDPIRRTQNGLIHKKDRDRLLRESIISTPPAAFPIGSPNWPDFAIDVLVDWSWRVGLLVAEKEQFGSVHGTWWEEHSLHLPQLLARSTMAIVFDSTTLDSGTTSAKKPSDVMAWMNVVILAELAVLEPGSWVDLKTLIEANLNLISQGESDPTSTRTSKSRAKLPQTTIAEYATVIEAWISGPAWLGGLVQVAQSVESEAVCIQITDLGRFMMGHGEPPRKSSAIEKSLFIQPNLEGIFYRQGLAAGNLAKIVRLLKFTAIGPVIQGRLDEVWMRRMFASSYKLDRLLQELSELSAVPIASSVIETVRTWAGKSDRIRVYRSAILLETVDSQDRPDLIARFNADDPTEPVGESWLIVADEEHIPFKGLRIVAQQDQARDPLQCVRPVGDGTSLEVDSTKSDLALEPQLNRFTKPSVMTGRHSQDDSIASTLRFYTIDMESLSKALEQGVTTEWIESFFKKRSGGPTPASVSLLWKCTEFSAKTAIDTTRLKQAEIEMERILVLTCDDQMIIEGLMKLNATANLLGRRLGPNSVHVLEENLAMFMEQLGLCGLRVSPEFKIQPD